MISIRVTTLLVVGLCLLLAACAGSANPPPATAPATATTAPATVAATSTPAAAATARAAVTPAQPPAASPAAKAAASPSASPVSSDTVRLTLVAGENEARYRAREQLAGRSLPNEAVGTTKDVTGSIVLHATGTVVPEQSKIVVDLRSLRSDESRRDNFLQRDTLETSRYPTAEFVLKEVRGLPTPLPSSGEATIALVGDLTIKGVTRPTTWESSVRFTSEEVAGTAWTSFTFADFNMTAPRVGPVLSIEDEVRLELDFRARRETAAPTA